MSPLFGSWLVVTVILMVLVITRRSLEAREADWLPLATESPDDIRKQETIEKKVHRLTPIIHWLEGVDLVLLISLVGMWVYQGVNTVRW